MSSHDQDGSDDTGRVEPSLRRTSDSALLAKAALGSVDNQPKRRSSQPLPTAFDNLEMAQADVSKSAKRTYSLNNIHILESQPGSIPSPSSRPELKQPFPKALSPYREVSTSHPSLIQATTTTESSYNDRTMNFNYSHFSNAVHRSTRGMREWCENRFHASSPDIEMGTVDMGHGFSSAMCVDGTSDERTPQKQGRGYFMFPDEPSFLQWFKASWLDFLTLAICGGIALLVYLVLHPLPKRLFPLTYSSGQVVYPQFAYPRRKEYIPTWMSAVISFVVPFIFIGLTSLILIGSFWDANSAVSLS